MAEAMGDLVNRAFEAFNSRDLEGLLTLLHPDVRVRSLMTEAERTDYDGHQGVREWHAAVVDIFPDWRPRPRDVRDLDDAAVVLFDVTATAAASGVRIEQCYWLAAHARDGAVDFFGFFRSEDDALDALERSAPE